ncbi:MAG: PEP-CTERM sorting domain-containing protein, partial [Verrucomicrobia bacterium]|nr:PEP-CTERM sorting domain-containing protein [Verrucomicrobiota bacterium]
YFYLNGNNNALTLGPTSSITGDVSIYPSGSSGTAFTNQGTLTHTGGSSSIYAGTFTNSGTITANAGTLFLGSTSGSYSSANSGTVTANGSGTTVYLRGNFANTGTLAAQNAGILRFDGTNSSGNLGTVQLSTGGRAQLAGTLVNSSLAAPSGGIFELTGGTLQGGTIAPGALTFTNSGGYLDGATLNDNLNLPANSYVRFTGGASFTGATGSFASNSGVYWEQVGTLSNKAFTFATGAYFYLNGNNNALTLGPTSSITGDVSIYPSGSSGTAFTNQGTLTHTGGSSSIYAGTFTNSGTITANAGTLFLGSTSGSHNSANSGTITATGSGTTVYLRGNFANTGTLVAQNSAALRFDGDNTTANFGNVQLASGGRALLSGNFSNSHLAAPTGGAFELAGGTLTGGTVAPGALGFTSSGGYLDGVTLSGNLTLVAGSSYVRFLNGTTFTGSSASIASNAGIYWDQSGTLSGKSLTLGSSAYVYVVGAGHSLALDSATTATGALNFYSDGSTGTVISNQGNLTHTTGSGSLYAAAFTNSGTITATAGTLYLGYNSGTSSFANLPSGTIAVSGGTVQLRASSGNFVVNQGAINVQGGTLQTNNVLINAPGGTVSGAGTLSGGVTFTGGTLAPGNSVGTLTLTNSTFAVTGATTFAVELGGATSDLLLFQNPPTNVNLGSGLVSLSLTLLAPPTAATYDLIRIGSGSNVITGNFAGLPASGATLNASFGGNPYTFSITYQPSVIQLNFVAIPEPSTYALLATGAAAVLFLRRRRR